MKLTNKEMNGACFYGTTIRSSFNQLIVILGMPQFICNDRTENYNFNWRGETEEGEVFTIYDWKENRILDHNEIIDFHIGGFSLLITEKAKLELNNLLIIIICP